MIKTSRKLGRNFLYKSMDFTLELRVEDSIKPRDFRVEKSQAFKEKLKHVTSAKHG